MKAPPGYEIQRELGRGAMGVVYLARQLDLDRDVALKVLISETGDQLPPNALKRLRIEADIQAKVQHPNIVRIYTCDVDGPIPYLTFELVEGATTLHDHLVKGLGHLSLQERLGMAERIASAVAEMHDSSIVHRDLKPQNILIDVRGQIKVTDFGIGRNLLSSQTRVTVMVQLNDKAVGPMIGTPAYMSIEQLRGEEASFESDVYTLGLIVYELLAGHLVFSGQHPHVTALQRSASKIPPIQQFEPDIPDKLAALIARCFIEDRTGRPTAKDLWAALTSVVDTVPTDDSPRSGDTIAADVQRPPLPQQQRVARNAIAASPVLPRRPTRPGLVAQPVASAPALHPRVWWVAVAALTATVGTGFVVARIERTPVPSASASPAATRPVSALSDRLVAKATSLKHDEIGLPWLERFAKRQRSSLAACATKDSAAAREIALGIHANLEDLKVLEPLNEFVAVAPAYFADASIPDEVRWATRRALIDIELLERFCIEHRVPWSSVAAGSLVNAVDAAFGPVIDPATIDLRKARNWLRGPLTTTDRYFPGETRLVHWQLPELPPTERPLLWFATLRWPSGHLLDITVNGHYRTLLRMRQPAGSVPPITVNATELIDGTGRRSKPAHLVEAATDEAEVRSFTAIWLPPSAIATKTEVSITIVDLPGTAVTARNPSLIERVISFVPR